MPSIDWTLLASHGGESIESFIAVLLRRKYSDAIQTNPSQGDQGIDVYRQTDAGLVVWQIKKFTSPLTTGQWNQVKGSWGRFWDAKVAPTDSEGHALSGEQIAAYYLVTPWVPTSQRHADFATLTAAATFPTQWDSDAFLVGLTDEFPDSLARFMQGPALFDHMVNERALLASSPVERTGDLTMLDAIESRQQAITELRDLVSENYYIDSGTLTVQDGQMPLPRPGDAGLAFRYTSLGNNRFSYQAVVPRNDQAGEIEPITMQIEFRVTPGTDEAQQLTDWREWGVPFHDLRANVTEMGGPFGNQRHEESLLSVSLPPSNVGRPNLRLHVLGEDGLSRGSILMTPVEVTRGIDTDWIRIVTQSPSGVFRLDMRQSTEPERSGANFDEGHFENGDPAQVASEIALMESAGLTDTLAVTLGDDPTNTTYFAKIGGSEVSESLVNIGRVAKALASLQRSANTYFEMPDESTTLWQVGELEGYASIYEGNARRDTWTELPFEAIDDGDEIMERMAQGQVLVAATSPVVRLGNHWYQIDRPMVRSRRSAKFADHDPSTPLVVGNTYRLVPDGDDEVVTAAVTDWIPGDPPLGRGNEGETDASGSAA